MNRQFERYLQMSLIVLDLTILNVFYFISRLFFMEKLPSSYYTYLKYWAIINVIWLLLAFFLRNYAEKVILVFEHFTKRTIQVYLLWVIFVLVYLFFSRESRISRIFVIINMVGFGVGLLVNRFLYLGIKTYFKKSDYLIKKVVILGYNDTAKKLAKYFEEDSLNTQLLGFIEDNKNIHELSHYPVLSSIANTLEVAKELGAQEIFSTITPEQNRDIYKLMYEAERECIRFKIVPNLSVFITREVHIDYFGDLPILSLRSDPLDDVGNRIKKRVLDVLVSSFLILFVLS